MSACVGVMVCAKVPGIHSSKGTEGNHKLICHEAQSSGESRSRDMHYRLRCLLNVNTDSYEVLKSWPRTHILQCVVQIGNS
jgi:hypothetical protein